MEAWGRLMVRRTLLRVIRGFKQRKDMIRLDICVLMDWRGQSGSREANLMASAAILIRDGVAGSITDITEMGMWIDSGATRDAEVRTRQSSMEKEGKMSD